MGQTDQLMTNSGGWHSFWVVSSKKVQARKPRPCKHFHSKAGEGIRTLDVQLGNPERGDSKPCADNDLYADGAGI